MASAQEELRGEGGEGDGGGGGGGGGAVAFRIGEGGGGEGGVECHVCGEAGGPEGCGPAVEELARGRGRGLGRGLGSSRRRGGEVEAGHAAPVVMGVKRHVDEAVQGGGAGPFVQRVGVAGGHGVFVLPPARAHQLPLMGIGGAGDRRARRAVKGGDELEGAAQFSGRGGGEIGVQDKGADDVGDLVGGVDMGKERPGRMVGQGR